MKSAKLISQLLSRTHLKTGLCGLCKNVSSLKNDIIKCPVKYLIF